MMQKIKFMISSLRLWIFQSMAALKEWRRRFVVTLNCVWKVQILLKNKKRKHLIFFLTLSRLLFCHVVYISVHKVTLLLRSGLGAEVRLISQSALKTSQVSFNFLSCWHLENRTTFAEVWPWALAETGKLNRFCIPRDAPVFFSFSFFCPAGSHVIAAWSR